MITPDDASVEAYRGLRRRLSPATPVRLPVLAPGLRRYIEKLPFSFSDSRLASAKDIPIEVHIELQRWLRKIYLEFQEFNLRILLVDP